MGLSQMPPEVLRDLTEYLGGFEVCYLWLCGCKLLQLNLTERGGVRELTFSTARVFWPSIVQHFPKLESFTLCEDSNMYRTAQHGVIRLNQLPGTLKELHLECADDHDIVSTFLTQESTHFSNLTSLTLSPWMETAKILDKDGCIKCWPDTLTYLNFLASYANLRVDSLPSGLISLDARFDTILGATTISDDGDLEEGTGFPATLRHLRLVLEDTSVFWIDMIPTEIVECDIQYSEDSPELEMWSLESKLPHFTSLRKFGLDWGDYESESLTCDMVRALPASVVDLRLPSYLGEEDLDELLDCLPPHLTRFHGLFNSVLEDATNCLPRSLTELEEDIEIPITVAKLPPLLKAAVFGFPSDFFTDDMEMIAKRLRDSGYRFPMAMMDIELPQIGPVMAELLPASLTSLTISYGSVTENTLLMLPKSLKHLKLKGISEDAFKLLPPGLHSLLCATALDHPEMSHKGSRMVMPSIALTMDSASWLPRYLHTLDLRHVRLSSPSWFNALPPYLHTLRALVIMAFPDTPEQNPPNLKSRTVKLERQSHDDSKEKFDSLVKLIAYDWSELKFGAQQRLNLKQVHFTFDFLPSRAEFQALLRALPPALEQLSIESQQLLHSVQEQVCDVDLKLLPRHLRSLNLDRLYVAGLTKDATKYLPKRLERVEHSYIFNLLQ